MKLSLNKYGYIFYFAFCLCFGLSIEKAFSLNNPKSLSINKFPDIALLDLAFGSSNKFGYLTLLNTSKAQLTVTYQSVEGFQPIDMNKSDAIRLAPNKTLTIVLKAIDGEVVYPNFQMTFAHNEIVLPNSKHLKLRFPMALDTSTVIKGYQVDESHYNMVDIDAVTGTPIYAVSSGIVKYIKNDSDYRCVIQDKCEEEGNLITIVSEEGYEFRYAHIQRDSISLKVGQRVKEGEFIGKVGCTGYCLNPHLHLEVLALTGTTISPSNDDNDINLFGINFLPFSFYNCGPKHLNLSPNLVCETTKAEAIEAVSP